MRVRRATKPQMYGRTLVVVEAVEIVLRGVHFHQRADAEGALEHDGLDEVRNFPQEVESVLRTGHVREVAVVADELAIEGHVDGMTMRGEIQIVSKDSNS